MPTVGTYLDAYLGPLVTDARENAATTYVAELGTLPAFWVARLVVLRAYIVTCMESMKSPEDLFTAKLSAYRKEWDAALPLARAAQAAAQAQAGGVGSGASFFSVDLTRA